MNNDFNNLPQYSILMSVYSGEKPEYLKASLESMFNQTYQSDDLVLVCDGPLTKELDEVIGSFEVKYPDIFRVIRSEKNVGTGQCANIGIDACRHELIAKMDSDDIALENRFEKQISAMSKYPEINMCGGFIQEFDTDTGENIAVKKTPEDDAAIHQYAKRRNPFNNQTLIFKKSLAKSVGGYSDIKRCEDYEFVVRMLDSGGVGMNIQDVLVKYRVSANNYERRSNWNNTRSFIAVRWRIFRMGYSNIIDFIIPCLMQLGIFILPKSLTGKIYKKFLR
ncbi:MAG: glycosyltransferase [Oscillospiraceae bacterium]